MTKNIVDGVHLVSASFVNCYLIEDERGLTLVDTGLPAMWPQLMSAVADLGFAPRDISAVVLTHAHFDHTGCAARAQQELGLPILAHPDDHYIAAHPYRYRRQRPAILYPLRYPRAIRILGSMARAGAFKVRGVRGVQAMAPDSVLDVPGRPRVVFTPGHTAGHCALHLPDRGALITGDALVTLDPYTGFTGPQIVARAATADTGQALASLDALAATGAQVVLPGHGAVWRTGVQAAVDHAKTHHTSE